MAQKFFVEKADGGSEKVIIDKLIDERITITFKEDSADYIIRPNVKKMSMGRAKGGILIINAKSGDLVAQTKELYGSARVVNGMDNPVSDVFRRICKKDFVTTISPLILK